MSAATDAKPCYLFVGNPGTGKSTLINGVIGKPLFKSGESYTGSGITFQFDQHEVPGFGVFMDTPGLADEHKKTQAAEAITTALKQNGFYRLFFVLTLSAGRVIPADKTTMKLILEAAPTITDYNIIVNKVEKKWLDTLLADPEGKLKPWMTTLMCQMPKLTTSVHFMLRDEKLAGEDDVKYDLPNDLLNFITQAPGMVVQSTDVNDVHADEFDRLEKEHEEKLKELEEEKEAMAQEMEEQKADMERAVKRAKEAAKQAEREKELAAEKAREQERALELEKRRAEQEIAETRAKAERALEDERKKVKDEENKRIRELEKTRKDDEAKYAKQVAELRKKSEAAESQKVRELEQKRRNDEAAHAKQIAELNKQSQLARERAENAERARQSAQASNDGPGVGRVLGAIFSLGVSEAVIAMTK